MADVRRRHVEGIERFHEERRERWLSVDELQRLTDALDGYPNERAANAIRLLVLTGARKSEVLAAEWSQLDLERGVWTKPSSHTKQKKTERVPLSEPTIALLSKLKREAFTEVPFVFPGDVSDRPVQDIKKAWSTVCEKAGLEGVRLHDLRHTYASHLVSSGLSLELVGRLLGHTQAATTKRYAHIADDPLRCPC